MNLIPIQIITERKLPAYMSATKSGRILLNKGMMIQVLDEIKSEGLEDIPIFIHFFTNEKKEIFVKIDNEPENAVLIYKPKNSKKAEYAGYCKFVALKILQIEATSRFRMMRLDNIEGLYYKLHKIVK